MKKSKLIKMMSNFNKNHNQYYYKTFLELCSNQLAKYYDSKIFNSIIMSRFGEIKVAKEIIYGAKNKQINK